MPDSFLILSDASVFLLSPWKPLIIWGVVIWWAWLVATRIQPDARYYQLNLPRWNMAFLLGALLGIGSMIFGGMFYIGWPVGVLVMFAPVLVYWKKRNAAVPEDRKFRLSFARSEEARQARATKRATRNLVFTYVDAHDQLISIPPEDDPAHEIFQILESFLAPALEARAVRMDLGLSTGGCVVTQTVDTVRSRVEKIETDPAAKVFNLIRTFAGLQASETRREQTGEFMLKSPTRSHTITVTASGSSKGQLLRLDVDRADQVRRPFDGLGLLDPQRKILDAFIPEDNRHGIVLISAPPGQGLTTTGYALMSCHDSYTSNVRSLERSVETTLEGTVQKVFDPSDASNSFGRTLQSMLRRDPDVIYVSEVPDQETAITAAKSGTDGPLLYVAITATSTADCLKKWTALVGDSALAAAPVRAVVHQRLFRTLCDNCKVAYVPTDTGRFRLPEGTELYRAGGQIQDRNKVIDCPVCGGSGYLGATGVFEVTPITPDGRKAFAKGDFKGVLTAARREKMMLLGEAAMRRAVSGSLSLEEISRVLSPSKKRPPAAATASST